MGETKRVRYWVTLWPGWAEGPYTPSAQSVPPTFQCKVNPGTTVVTVEIDLPTLDDSTHLPSTAVGPVEEVCPPGTGA